MADEIVKEGTRSTSLPAWMQQALFNTIQAGQQWAAKPYQPYNAEAAATGLDAAGNMVADPSSMTEQAWQQAQDMQGAWEPTMDTATQAMGALMTANGAAQVASPYMNQQDQMLTGIDYNAGVNSMTPYIEQAMQYNPLAAGAPNMNVAGDMARASTRSTVDALTNAQQEWLSNPDAAFYNLQRGSELTTQGAQGSSADAANPYANRATQMSAYGAAQPWLQQAGEGRALDAAQPYFDTSASERALAAADPYMRQAGQTSVQNIDQYMNPYNRNVTDEIARLGARNLQENLLPATSDAFIKAGSFGGTRMGEFGSRAVRDTQESILGQQAQALQQGYGQGMQASQADLARQAQLAGTAGSIAGADLSRFANLGQSAGQLSASDLDRLSKLGGQAGQLMGQDASIQANLAGTMGGLSNSDFNRMVQGGGQLANIAQGQQQLGLNAASTAQQADAQDLARTLQASGRMESIGNSLGNLTNQQAQNLMGAGQSLSTAQQNAISGALSGAGQMGQMGQLAGNLTQTDLARQQAGVGTLANLARQGQQMAGTDIGMLSGAGTQQQQNQQNVLNTAYGQWQQQQQYPQRNLGWMASMLSGTPTQQSVTSTVNTGEYNPSTFERLLGDAAAVGSIGSNFGWWGNKK